MLAAEVAYSQAIYQISPGNTAALISAVRQANRLSTSAVIRLSPGTYVFNTPDNAAYGPTALPVITGDITIEGNGASIERPPDAPSFRFLAVSNELDSTGRRGRLSLRNLTLRGGLAEGGAGGDGIGGGGGAGMGGALFCRGELHLDGVLFENNTARGGQGGSDNQLGQGGGGGGLGGNGGDSLSGMGGGGAGAGSDGLATAESAVNGGNGGGITGGVGGVAGNSGEPGEFGGGGGGGGTQGAGGAGGFGGGGGGGGEGAAGGAGGLGGGGGGRGGNGGYGGGAGGTADNLHPSIPGFGGGDAGAFAGGGGAGFGGALYLDGATGSLVRCVFRGNTAEGGAAGVADFARPKPGKGKGGALFARPGTCAVHALELSFEENFATDTGQRPGDRPSVFGLLDDAFLLEAGSHYHDIELQPEATCVRIPLYLINQSPHHAALSHLRFDLVVMDSSGALDTGSLTPESLSLLAFTQHHATPPECNRVAEPDSPIDYPAGNGNAVWSIEGDGLNGGFRLTASAPDGEAMGSLAPGERVALGTLNLPLRANASPGTVRILLQGSHEDESLNSLVELLSDDEAATTAELPFAVTSAGEGRVELRFEIPGCDPASVTITDNVSGAGGTMAQPPLLRYRDAALGGQGGNIVVFVEHPSNVDRVVLVLNGVERYVAPQGESTLAVLSTIQDGFPALDTDAQTLGVAFERVANASGLYHRGALCQTNLAWEATTCELVARPGDSVAAGKPVHFDAVLRNARSMNGNFGALTLPGGTQLPIVFNGRVFGNTVVVPDVHYVPAASQAQRGLYTVTTQSPKGSQLAACALTLRVDSPSDITLTGGEVTENTPAGFLVGLLGTVDADQTLGHVYTLAPGEGDGDNSGFRIEENLLFTNMQVDFESKPVLRIRVRSTDLNGNFVEVPFEILVGNVDEPASSIGLSSYGLEEGHPVPVTVGELFADDPDGQAGYTFVLAPVSQAPDNKYFRLSGKRLEAVQPLLRSVQEFYEVRIRSQYLGEFVMDQTLVVYVREPALHDNGFIVTNAGAGFGSAALSELQEEVTGQTTTGWNADVSLGARLSDDFEVVASHGWRLEQVTVFAYESGSPENSTIDYFTFRIWDGPPNAPESRIIFGDDVTNRISTTAWTGIYRVNEIGGPNATSRPVMSATARLGESAPVLPPGVYWLDWQLGGASDLGGPFCPHVTVTGRRVKGNALQYVAGKWNLALTGFPEADQVAMPFRLGGTAIESTHSADTNRNSRIELSELLRVVQFYNANGYRCDEGTEDGYTPGAPEGSCNTHDADYAARDGVISLGELLRMTQLFNVGAYARCEGSEDGFCAAPA